VKFLEDYNFMEAIEIQNKKVAFSSDGYLVTSELWNEDIAIFIAKDLGIQKLDEKHWAIIYYVREYWMKNGTAPLIRHVCQHTGIRLSLIYELFPMGPAKGACRIAGLPRPDGCV
jgi:tRNA 2-thiouridine synthesizing protein E